MAIPRAFRAPSPAVEMTEMTRLDRSCSAAVTEVVDSSSPLPGTSQVSFRFASARKSAAEAPDTLWKPPHSSEMMKGGYAKDRLAAARLNGHKLRCRMSGFMSVEACVVCLGVCSYVAIGYLEYVYYDESAPTLHIKLGKAVGVVFMALGGVVSMFFVLVKYLREKVEHKVDSKSPSEQRRVPKTKAKVAVMDTRPCIDSERAVAGGKLIGILGV